MKITRHSKRQENMVHNKENNKLVKTDPEMTHMTEANE